MAYFHSPRIITNGLILCLDAANPKSYPGSGTIWNDLSGNDNHGTLMNGPTFNTNNKGSVVFDGVNDYVTLGTNISDDDFPTNNFTLSCWFKWNGSGGGSDGRNYLLQNGGSNYPLSMEINSRDFTPARFATWEHTTNGNAHRNSNVTVNTDQWYHFVISKGLSNTIKMFVDGNEIFSANSIGGSLLSFSGLRIGTFRSANNRWFDGNIAQVQIYNRALTANEVMQNFKATKSRFGL